MIQVKCLKSALLPKSFLNTNSSRPSGNLFAGTTINHVHGIYVSDRLLIIFYVRLYKNTWYYFNNKFRIPSPSGLGVFKVLVFSDLWRIVSQYLLRYCVTCSQMCMIVQVLKNLVLHYNLKGVAMLAQTTLTCVASASNNSSVQAWWWQSLAKC